MRAVAVNSVPENPAVAEVDTPRPEAGEVLVKVAASSVNGFDLSVAAGYLQGMMEHRFPLIVGKDFAGTVEALGDGVDDSAGFAVGDAVFGVLMKPVLGPGSLAEYVIVPSGNVLPKPPELTFAEAACLPTAWLTAYRMLFVRSDLRPGQTVEALQTGESP